MRTINDLKQTLTEHEPAAPDSFGILDAAASRAHRLRRRRRLGAIAAPALSVVAVIAAASFVVRSPDNDLTGLPAATASQAPSESPAPSKPPAAQRKPGHMTVDLSPGSKYFKQSAGVNGSTQLMVLRARQGEAVSFGGDVIVHDAGTFKPGALLHGERVSIPGKATQGYFQMPDTLGWENTDGSWVIVSGDKNREGLVRTMQDIVFTPEYAVKASFKLSYLPAGLNHTYLSVSDDGTGPGHVRAALGRAGEQVSMRPGDILTRQFPLYWFAGATDDYLRSHTPSQKDAVKVNGNNVWYLDGSNAGSAGVSLHPGGAAIVIANQHCYALFSIVNAQNFPRAEQEKIAAGFSFADCRNPGKWVEPFS